ncbi:SRPBCC domain-containing protein [Niastella caeni]|uniref:SRPBCC domain-containing protein n=1 Tax=Niastella caeni TaxID=2569763 RepID=A0A4S8I410_9BACT|nr:SRPBCC domain-containing protein [Niastella caeni]THU41974.1 SRPBCC domain-containing protein [Niastella caeni]
MSTIDWSRFVTRINVSAPIETLYLAWATRAGMESWFVRLSEYRNNDGKERAAEEQVIVGDTYKWLWHGYSDEAVEHGQILDLNNKDYFKFSFGKAGICSVNIRPEEGEHIVELIQEDIPIDEQGKLNFHVGCKTGWTFYLANLKSIVEGGIDLRNKNVKLKQVLNS